MPSLRQYLLPHRLRELLICCPVAFQTYATFHLDSIRKILNHLLAILFASNVFLLVSSWNVAFGATSLGPKVVLIALLLAGQTALVYSIVNNAAAGGARFAIVPRGAQDPAHPSQQQGGGFVGSLSPTDFMLGVALGVTVGGSILAFVVSSAFSRPPWPCDYRNYGSTLRTFDPPSGHGAASGNHSSPDASDPVITMDSVNYRCHQLYVQGSGSSFSIWFWASLVFWINFCVSLLLAAGRRDLSVSSAYGYEHIGGGVDDASSPPNAASAASFPGDMSQPRQASASASASPSFVGDYARIPEIRSDNGNAASSGPPASEKSRIVVSL
jgi:hypothetical protein